MPLLTIGQGSQFVGMGKDLYHLYPRSARLVFDEADEAVGGHLRQLIFDGQQVQRYPFASYFSPVILTLFFNIASRKS